MKRIMVGVTAALLAIVGGMGLLGEANAQSQGLVRVLHASPDAPDVDVLVNGDAAFSGVAFGEITSYAPLAPDTYNVQVVPAGAMEPVVIDADLPVAAGTDTTVVAVGLLDAIEPLVLTDNNAAPAAGKAHVRFVHASPDAPAVDVAVTGGAVLFDGIAFKAVGDYLPVDAGTYDLEVRLAGTDTVALEVPGVMLDAGKVYSVFALGLADGTPALSAKLTVDATHEADAPSAPAASEAMPTQLPKTGASDALPLFLMAAAALAIGAGLALRRRAVTVTNR